MGSHFVKEAFQYQGKTVIWQDWSKCEDTDMLKDVLSKGIPGGQIYQIWAMCRGVFQKIKKR